MLVYKNDGSGELHVFMDNEGKHRHFSINKGRVDEDPKLWTISEFQIFISNLRQVPAKTIPTTSKVKIRELINGRSEKKHT